MSDYPIKSPRKLIEVALPLDAINVACAAEKMPGIGPHPRGLHLWWARRPLAAARAVLFAQLVNDPGSNNGRGFKYGTNKKEAATERKRLFKILEELVLWENSDNEELLERAQAEIDRSWREVCVLNKDHPLATDMFNPNVHPAFHDPFAGGGAIPIEAARLGLNSYSSDLNTVAVLINKAMIEIPSSFAGLKSVNPDAMKDDHLFEKNWFGSKGLAADIKYYGEWMRDEAQKLIGNRYPNYLISPQLTKSRPDLKEYEDKQLKVIAWIWARTVASPNPAFRNLHTPLIKSFKLASQKGTKVKEGMDYWIEPIVDTKSNLMHFNVRVGKFSQDSRGTIGREAAQCLFSNSPIDLDYIREEGKAGRLGQRLIAVVADGRNGRIYLPPNKEHEQAAIVTKPDDIPSIEIEHWSGCTNCVIYGFNRFESLFTNRQLLALSTFSMLLKQVILKIEQDASIAGLSSDGVGLANGGNQARAYAEAVAVYLSFAISRTADFGNSFCAWSPTNQKVMHLFGKQAIPMVWDYSEANVLEKVVGGFAPSAAYIATCVEKLPTALRGHATQADAQSQNISAGKVISTDPPYYDNVPYSNLSDFFYLWLRGNLSDIYPQLLKTIAVPRTGELVATASRHGGKENAQKFFLDGMSEAMKNISSQAHPAIPLTIYYAFKQSETSTKEGTSSPGWETFLEAVINSGMSIVGTWPLRSEQEFRMMGIGMNALASSIVLVCRKRSTDSPTILRREFIRELNVVLPEALDEMTKGADGERSPVAPVDLSQAIIGPGMSVFSKYTAVLEADGSSMSVRTALQLINRFLAEDDFDADTQFCLHWFEQHGWTESVFGEADVLARSKSTSVDAMKEAGILQSGSGKVRLLKWVEYPADWDPRTDTRTPVWEALHHLIRALKKGGESASGLLLAALGGKAEAVRQLAYRLYTLCERLGQAEDARAYNELITSWTGIETAANSVPKPAAPQGTLFDN
jgi:putative DNA methylase